MRNNLYTLKHVVIAQIITGLLLTIMYIPMQAQIGNIWALGDGEKVYRNNDHHPDKAGNNIWDGKSIHLKGMYNEVIAFQVILEAGKQGASGINIAIEAPIQKTSGKTIGANTLKYGPGGTIEIFSEHYLKVTDTTHPNWFYGSPAAAPANMKGWIPDALIPANALPGTGGLPLDIPAVTPRDSLFMNAAYQNQGFWVDIHLPRDQEHFPAGVYNSTIQVYEKGKLLQSIPLEITLLPLYLPEENHTHVWLFSGHLKPYFPELEEDQIDKMIKFEAHRHRIDMTGGFDVNAHAFNENAMDKYKPWLTGSGFTAENGYQGPGIGTAEKLFPIGVYGADIMGQTKDAVQSQSNQWVDWFQKNSPGTRYFWYIIDEPQDKKLFPWIKERASWVKTNPGSGKRLPIFTTSHYVEDLATSIDIWAAYNGVDIERMAKVKKTGGDYWFYNGNRPRIGSTILEAPAVDFRVNSWIMYKYDVLAWYIWEGTQWQHNQQGPKAHLHQNVFVNPLTFINSELEFGNGDGVLFYPGKMPFYPEQNRGLNQVLPSIRIKNIRRGQQDANIMWMAEQKIGRPAVLAIISKVLPKAMSEVDMNSTVPWSQHAADFDKVREELLKILVTK
jgi:hypothetical protein